MNWKDWLFLAVVVALVLYSLRAVADDGLVCQRSVLTGDQICWRPDPFTASPSLTPKYPPPVQMTCSNGQVLVPTMTQSTTTLLGSAQIECRRESKP